jgi:hypothetical protein
VDIVDYSEDEDLVLVSTNGVHKHSLWTPEWVILTQLFNP